MKGYHKERGLTLIELMMVITIIAIVLTIGTLNFLAVAPGLKLRSTAEQVATRVRLIQMRSVATNKRGWVRVYPSAGFYTGFIDSADYGIININEYPRTELDMPESQPSPAPSGVPGFILPADISFGWPSDFVSGKPTPDGIVFPTSAINTSDGYVGFSPTGMAIKTFGTGVGCNAVPTESVVIFIKNMKNQGYCVAVAPTGRVRVFKWTGSNWQ